MQLYALCDQETLDRKGVSLEEFVALCHKHHAVIVQYRNKTSDKSILKNQLLQLRNLWNGLLIINDAVDLVAYCDGLHVGQEDLQRIDSDFAAAVSSIRQRIGSSKLLGISTHNEEEILFANTLDLDYIGLGAYRTTATKDVSTVLGDSLDMLASLSVHDVAAIGGICFEDEFEHVKYRVMGSALYEN